MIFKATQAAGPALSDAEIVTIQIDAPTQEISFSASSSTTGEGGPAVLLVRRTGGTIGTVTVQVDTSNLTASGGTDYAPRSEVLTFASGESARIVSVPILNDPAPELAETFRVSLSQPTGGAELRDPTMATVTIVDDDTPSASGQWGPVLDWPTVPIHSHLLPTGKVLFWDRHDHALGWDGDPRVWDPIQQEFAATPLPGYDIFCSGHGFLEDGRLLVAGGHIHDAVGEAKASVYDPFANTWDRLPNMNAGRWYPTNTTLSNGEVLTVGGTATGFGAVNPIPQVWQDTTGTWRDLSGAPQGNYPEWADFYPFLYVAPNGRIFDAGPQQTSRYLETAGTGHWTDVADSALTYRDYGSSVMYGDGKVLIVGGNPREPDPNAPPTLIPSASAEVIDLDAVTPAWRSVTAMSVGRRHLNTTLLPDGKVLVTGGSSSPGFDDPSGAVFFSELWDPQSETWTPTAGYTRYRGYHSVALLLPDGRVLIGGGGHPDPPGGTAEQNVEIYSPPYLFKGARPTIANAPAHVTYGESFPVETADAASIAAVSWIRLSSVTHAFNQGQRINHLSFTPTSDGLLVTAPASGASSPPGHYLLFILNGNGVPSVARIVQIGPGVCSYSLSSTSQSFAAGGGAGGASLAASPACTWSATSNADWITVTGNASGTGDGEAFYSVGPNAASTRRIGTISIAGRIFTVLQGGRFNDVPPSHPFHDFIGKLSARGVTAGCGGGNYCPGLPVSRGQMAVFIIQALGETDLPTPTSQRFADVPPSHPFFKFIDRVAALNITSGCGGGNYCPDKPVTREQMAVFLIQALMETDLPTPATQRFLDVAPSSPFFKFVDRIAVLGITGGCSVSPPRYCPTDAVTRGQMAVFLVAAFKL